MTTLGGLTTPPNTATAAALAAITTKLLGTTTLSQAFGIAFVEDFYPDGLGPTGLTQTPSSHLYATIADYIAALPTDFQASATSFAFATPLVTDQCDWIAFQTAANYIFDNFGGGGAIGAILWSSPTVVNRTITVNAYGINIEGLGTGSGFGTVGPSITYNGSGGTIDAPVAILDLYNYDEFGYANGRPTLAASGGIKAVLSNFSLFGKGGDMHSANQNVSAYVSGIRLRAFNGCRILGLNFGGTLYDGIYNTGPGLFMEIDACRFYGVHRDAISCCGCATNFTTTVWITHNDFGFIGRYAIMLDFSNATTPTPIIKENSLEFTFSDSYYLLHPEWFVCGVVGGMCLHNCGNAVISGNYWEGVVGPTAYDVAVHLHASSPVTITDDNMENLFLTTEDIGQAASTAGTAFQNGAEGFVAVQGVSKASTAHVSATSHDFSNNELIHFFLPPNSGANTMTQLFGPTNGFFTVKNVSANAFDLYNAAGSAPIDSTSWGTFSGSGTLATSGTHYFDITNARNYRVGYTANFGPSSTVNLRALPGLNKILFADDFTLDGTILSSVEDSYFGFWKVATVNASGRDGKKVQRLQTPGAVIYANSPNVLSYRNVGNDSRSYGQFNSRAQSGNYTLSGPTAPTWAAATAYSDIFQNNYLFGVQQLIQPTSGHWTGYVYQCIVAGTSHATTEPTWRTDTTPFTDGTVTWQLVGLAYLSSESTRSETMEFGSRRFQVETSTPPTVGLHSNNDQVFYRLPVSGGKIGEVCVTSGVPGTWKSFGVIS